MIRRYGVVATISTVCIVGCSAAGDGSTTVGAAPSVSSDGAKLLTYRMPNGETKYYEAGDAPSGAFGVHRQTDARGAVIMGTPLPGVGLGAPDLQDAYGIALSGGPSPAPTVAIWAGQDDPNAEADLNVYRAQVRHDAVYDRERLLSEGQPRRGGGPIARPSLPPPAGRGRRSWPTTSRWHRSAARRARSCSWKGRASRHRGRAAITLGATYISDSWGVYETASLASNESGAWFSNPAISFFSWSGAYGFEVFWPSTSAHVTAVGGTTLDSVNGAPWWSESAWWDAGAGCSAFIAKPSWQPDYGCGSMRAVSDVSAVATNVEIYDSWAAGGWANIAGTSISAPLMAGIYAHNGWTGGAAYAYAHQSSFTDVYTGSDGTCGASAPALCNSGLGWDGPTGLGSPFGSAPVHELSPSPIILNVAAGGSAQVELVWSDANWANPVSCSVVAASLPAGVTGTCFEYYANGVFMTIAPADTTPPQTFVATAVSTSGTETRATEVTVNVTACVPETTCGVSCETTIVNGCGGTLSCNGCPGGDTCLAHTCVAAGSKCPAGKVLKNGVCVFPMP